MKTDGIPWEKKGRIFQCEGRQRGEEVVESLSWESTVLEILHLLVFLEQRGMKHLYPRLPTQVEGFVTLLRGFKSSAGKRVCQVYADMGILYQTGDQETINVSEAFGEAPKRM